MTRYLPLLTFFLPACLLAENETKKAPVTGSKPAADQPIRMEEMIDSLDQSSLQEAFRLLTSDYIHESTLDPLEINRAALQGMLDRLEFGAMLLTEKGLDARNSPFRFDSEKLNEDTAYIRFGRYTRKDLEQFDEAIAEFVKEEKCENLILDLRSPQAQAEFAIASEILSRFRPPSELLFKIRRPGNDRPTLFISQAVATGWRGNLVLLVDRETGNVGEIIAAVLKRESSCLIIGEKTPGLTVEYRDVPIGEDRILRYAIAEVVLEDDSSIFRTGIEPDIETPTPLQAKRSIFRASEGDETLTPFLYQKQRPRMNEAALVAGTDPEIDDFILRSNNKPTPWDKPPLQDRALQQAVDLLDTSRFLDSDRKPKR
jgi:hypothetical protein